MVLCKTPWPVMINQINEDFGFHQKALALRQQRPEVLATNIANSDTPNYKARDIDFASALSQALDATTRLPATQLTDRTSVVSGKGVSVRVDLGGRRSIKKKMINDK